MPDHIAGVSEPAHVAELGPDPTTVTGPTPNQAARSASAPARALIDRLAARTGNPYGKARGDMDQILGDLAAVEPLLRKAADHEIRTTIPLADVVAKVVHLAGTRPGGLHHAGRARAEHRP